MEENRPRQEKEARHGGVCWRLGEKRAEWSREWQAWDRQRVAKRLSVTLRKWLLHLRKDSEEMSLLVWMGHGLEEGETWSGKEESRPGRHPEYVFTLTLVCLPEKMAEGREQRGLWEEAPPVGVSKEDGEGQRALSGWDSGSQETKPPFYPTWPCLFLPCHLGAQGPHSPPCSHPIRRKSNSSELSRGP